MKRSAFLAAVVGAAALSVGACVLLDEPQQCASDGDCARFGAVCDTKQALCVAPRTEQESMVPDEQEGGLVPDVEVAPAPDASAGPPRSCYALHREQPSLGSGIHEIDPDGPGVLAPRRVYCDMTFDKGGWTLVARSVASGAAAAPFGWLRASGSVDDDSAPYSYGAAEDLAFTQLLVASHGGGKAPTGNAYRLEVPKGLVTMFKDAAFAVNRTFTVLGSCQPPSRVAMFAHVGFTAREDGYWFRDVPGFANFGLSPQGWRLFYANDCNGAGLLDGAQGLIFVR